MQASQLLFVLSLLIAPSTFAKSQKNIAGQRMCFIENKGQVRDQYGGMRNDIDYMLRGSGISTFIGKDGIHYQFYKRTPDKCYDQNIPDEQKNIITKQLNKDGLVTVAPCEITGHRLDVMLVGANKNAQASILKAATYYERYFGANLPEVGIKAASCLKIVYKDVYPDIDWVIFVKEDKMEYEFIVGDKGDASQIKLRYDGQTSLQVNLDGSITAVTPLGTIKEHAPVCYTPDGQRVNSTFNLKNNEISFNIDRTGALIIDPIVEWGTYYGNDTIGTYFNCLATDNAANIYGCGFASGGLGTSVATTGSYQSVFAGGDGDAFLVKFDSSGNRLWATFYGGSVSDWAVGLACDPAGNIYMGGSTSSPTGIATAGAQQTTFAGGLCDGFLAKFDGSGNRLWGTYVGGPGANFYGTVSCDNLGHVYISGVTNDATAIATSGGYHPTKGGGYENYLIQYDAAGVRQWGTYFGGSGDEFGGVVGTDGINAYLTGITSSATGIATLGAYHPTLNGPGDVYVARFNTSGALIWSSYYGGEQTETIGDVICDRSGNVYLYGTTYSDTGIATTGAYQPARGGAADAFLEKIDPDTGFPIWGTYFGGPSAEIADDARIISDNFNNIYITGSTGSTTGIASSTDCWQPVFGGDSEDGFLAKYNTLGVQQWSTYFGGTLKDQGRACAFDGKAIYLAGQTYSANNISTPGSFWDDGGGSTSYFVAYLAKFIDTSADLTLNIQSAENMAGTLKVYPNPASGSFSLNWNMPGMNEQCYVAVFDMTGKTVWDGELAIRDGIANEVIELSSAQPTGTYFIRAATSKYVWTTRIIKQ